MQLTSTLSLGSSSEKKKGKRRAKIDLIDSNELIASQSSNTPNIAFSGFTVVCLSKDYEKKKRPSMDIIYHHRVFVDEYSLFSCSNSA